MSEEITEIPVVSSEQVGAVQTVSHFQSVIVNSEDEKVFMVMWDGSVLRLLLPYGVDLENNIVSYKVLGHVEVSLPFPLDPITMERQAHIVISSYHQGLAEEEKEENSDDNNATS